VIWYVMYERSISLSEICITMCFKQYFTLLSWFNFFFRNWLLAEEIKFRGPWFYITIWAINSIHSLQYIYNIYIYIYMCVCVCWLVIAVSIIITSDLFLKIRKSCSKQDNNAIMWTFRSSYIPLFLTGNFLVMLLMISVDLTALIWVG
jgi:hypothetical protein